MGVLADLAAELGLSAEQLRSAITAEGEALTPNYLTTNAAGQVSADFTGRVYAAGGIDINAGDQTGTPTQRRVRWIRLSDGAVIGEIYAANSGAGFNDGQVFMSAETPDQQGFATLSLSVDTGDGNQHINVNAQNDATGADGSALLIDSLGQSSFLQTTGAAKWIDRGPYTAAYALAAGGSGGVPINIGFNAIAGSTWVYGANNSSNGGDGVSWSFTFNTLTQININVHNNLGVAVSGQIEFYIRTTA